MASAKQSTLRNSIFGDRPDDDSKVNSLSNLFLIPKTNEIDDVETEDVMKVTVPSVANDDQSGSEEGDSEHEAAIREVEDGIEMNATKSASLADERTTGTKENKNNDKDMSGRKVDKDEEERTIFVGNLPLSTTRKSLKSLFKDCGKVLSTRFRSIAMEGVKLPPESAGNQSLVRKVCFNTGKVNTTTKKSSQGYVVFASKSSIPSALKMNNKILRDDEGKELRIRVDTCQPTIDPDRSVFVGGLPYATSESQLTQHFARCGDILGVRVIRDKETMQCKGFGYVLFEDIASVPNALRLHNSLFGKKRNIRVMVCGKKKKNNYRNSGEDISGNVTGAERRLLKKRERNVDKDIDKDKVVRENKKQKKMHRRKSDNNKISIRGSGGGGISKRASKEKKQKDRSKKLEKRMKKGMGKSRKY